MTHPVVWFEVIGKDGARLQQFYAQLFGWKIDANNPTKYGLVEVNGRGIPGGIGAARLAGRSWVTFYVETTDPQAMLQEPERLGGRVVLAPQRLPDGVTIAVFEDLEGHAVGLVTPAAA